MDFIIRQLKQNEVYILKDMVYEAIFQRKGEIPLPKTILENPEISVYFDDWGKDDDNCFVAEINGKIIGAVWTRILDGKIKGFGNIDSQTPEFAISLFKEYRNKGIGMKLMQKIIEQLKNMGYKNASLSVAKDNYAYKMYVNLGFKVIEEKDEDYLMLLELH